MTQPIEFIPPFNIKRDCPHCAEKETYIKELEQALDGAVWPRRDDTATLVMALKLSPQQAELVGLLYRAAPRALTVVDIEAALKPHTSKMERTTKLVHVVVRTTRQRLGTEFIETNKCDWRDIGVGYNLSTDARRMVARMLGDDPDNPQPVLRSIPNGSVYQQALLRLKKRLEDAQAEVAMLAG